VAAVAPPSSTPAPPRAPVRIEMKNVLLHADRGLVLDVRHLRGEMISKSAGQPPVFDDQRSYVLRVHAAEVSRWRYLPTTLNGAPVPVIMTVTVSFKLG
jgi:hypothetical protein